MLQITSALAELINLKYTVDGDGIRDPHVNRFWNVQSSEDGAVTVSDVNGQTVIKDANAPEVDKVIKSLIGW